MTGMVLHTGILILTVSIAQVMHFQLYPVSIISALKMAEGISTICAPMKIHLRLPCRYHAYSEGHYYAPNDDRQNAQLEIL